MNKEEYVKLELPKEYTTDGKKEQVWIHSTTHFEMMENVGALRHIEGAKYPMKGIPTPDKVQGVNIIKTLLREFVKYSPLFIFVNKNKLFASFNILTNRILKSTVVEHIAVPHKYLCATSHGVYSIIANFLVNVGVNEEIAENTAYNIAHIFEHDDAWRYRLQDMATECDINAITDNPTKEIKRLLKIYRVRQNMQYNPKFASFLTDKIELLIKPLYILFLIPKFKNAFVQTAYFIKTMEYDDSDWYWVCLRDDYNYGGKTIEERSKGITPPKLYLME